MQIGQPAKSKVSYVTGPLHSGKTTAMQTWAEGRKDVGGILQPKVQGERRMVDLATGNDIPMAASADEIEVLQIGKFRFSQAAFVWAARALLTEAESPFIRFIIFDEIGPLELHGQGLHPPLSEVLTLRPQAEIVLVIRDYLLEETLVRYGVQDSAQPFPFPEN